MEDLIVDSIQENPDISNIPGELKTRNQWVAWRMETRDGKPTKVPYNFGTGRRAQSTNPETWGTWEDALQALQSGQYSGVGFVFSEDDPYTGVDLDKVRNPETGELTDYARNITADLDGYAEISPSGTGVHVIVRGTLPGAHNRRGVVEAYSHGRYFTITGDAIPSAYGTDLRTIPERQEELERVYENCLAPLESVEDASSNGAGTGGRVSEQPDETILERAFSASNGAKLSRLWEGDLSDFDGDHSAADHSFVGLLWFWTQDPEQIKRLHAQSGLARRKSARPDYLDRSINKIAAKGGEVFDWNRREMPHLRAPITGPEANGKAPEEGERKYYPRADAGNAERLVDTYGHLIRWVREWKCWIVWDGKRWAADSGATLTRMARATARSIHHDAAHETDRSEQEKVFKWAIQSQNETRIRSMVSMARADLEIRAEDLDTDPWALNCQNGTLDLRTGELRRHNPEDLITKIVPVEYDPNTYAPRFLRFLDETLLTEDLIGFVRRFAGYTLTGDTSERCFAILHGVGKNGKSTLVELFQYVLGDYSKNTDTETVLQKKYSGVGNDVAALAGARFVSAAEVEKGRQLAESKVKNLTGSDTITARFLFSEPFDFRPQFKLWLSTNNKPEIQGVDNAIWDRIKLIPFEQRFEGEKQDPRLPEKLHSEAAGVLAWMVEGCLEWISDGLGSAEAVDEATAGYRSEMDVLGEFFEERCVLDPEERVPFADLWVAYQDWCFKSGEKDLTKAKFGSALTERGYPSKRGGKNVAYRLGVTLSETERERQEADSQWRSV